MKKLLAILLVCGVFGMALSGCGSKADDSAGGAAAPAAPGGNGAGPAPATPAPAATTTGG
jgi:hypothetical protein